MRTCSDCGASKASSEFTRNKNTPWTHGRCKPCRAKRAREAKWAKLPDHVRRRREWLWLKRTYPGQVLVCLGCGRGKLKSEFVEIRTRPGAYYPRCRECRNAVARARYHGSPEVREAELARTRRNKLKRQGRTL